MKIQALLLETEEVSLVRTDRWNPATYLPAQLDEEESQDHMPHDCLGTVDLQTKNRPDLKRLDNSEFRW